MKLDDLLTITLSMREFLNYFYGACGIVMIRNNCFLSKFKIKKRSILFCRNSKAEVLKYSEIISWNHKKNKPRFSKTLVLG